MNVIKRDGKEVSFSKEKVRIAIEKANEESRLNGEKTLTKDEINIINKRIYETLRRNKRALSVEEIQDLIEKQIMKLGCFDLAKRYIVFRYKRNLIRKGNTTDESVLSLINHTNEDIKQENSNKNPMVISTQRDYMAGEVSKDLTHRILLPPDVVEADKQGIIHFHDADYYAQQCHNCDLVNLEDMLQNGTVISGVKIDKPHSFSTACTIATQIIAQVASSQYGGQSITLTHLAPFVDISRQKIKNEVLTEMSLANSTVDEYNINEIVERRLKKEIEKGVQTIQYQVTTLMTTNGQAPFITVFMYLNEAKNEQEKADLALIIEETIKQRYQGVKNEKGVWVTPAFPKLIYALEEDNISKDSKYYYLTELAAKCTAKRLVPDYISEKVMKKLKEENCFPSMGCRSFLSPYKDEDGKYKFYGRFNKGVVTINLPDVALSSKGNYDEFWRIFDERLELCHKALLCRYKRLKGTLSDVAPILWQHGALSRLKKGEVIDNLLVGGYSTISLGYAGLCECVKYMTGKSHTDTSATPFALEIMKYMNKKCDDWNKDLNLGFGIYGSPIESTTYTFAKCLQKRFGIIEGVTDKNYITNSYHVHVTEPIDAFSKLQFESQFQALSTGGAISYVEVPNMQHNIEGVLSIINFIYDNIMYAELNTKSDYCQVCGYDGEIQIIEDESGKLIWKCPNCDNTDQDKMNVSRRTCGKHIATIQNDRNSREIRSQVATDNLEPSHQHNTINNIFSGKKNYQYKCEVCGRPMFHKIVSYGHIYCSKHYRQLKKYGKFIDNNPRTTMDRNEIHICGDIAYVDIYDYKCNVIAQAIIDTKNINKIRYTKWKLSGSGYAMNTPKFKGGSLHMSRRILNTKQFVDHINHNTLDNRECNLRIVTKSQNQMNVNYKGVYELQDEKYYAYIKLNGKQYNLGVYVFQEEALFARWFAETLLFKEYKYPKEKPVILPHRELQIKEYVMNKVS